MESLQVNHIDNGTAINAVLVNHIAISADGTNWDYISKAGLSASKYAVQLNNTAPNSHPQRGKGQWVVVVKRGNEQILKFDPNKVQNQATWLGGAAEAQVAVTDINIWLSATS